MSPFNLFRNIPESRKNPSVFVWSLWAGGTQNSPGKLSHHERGRVVLCNVTACVNGATVARLKGGAKGTRTASGDIKRTVFAWLRGTVDASAVELVKGRPLTLNPHKGEWSFIYADTRQPCPVSFAYIIADPTGCFEASPALPPVN
tara:strand:+ start:387 stop:824 length:438 start_codon:yes stop_codon:yes gene_type:complete